MTMEKMDSNQNKSSNGDDEKHETVELERKSTSETNTKVESDDNKAEKSKTQAESDSEAEKSEIEAESGDKKAEKSEDNESTNSGSDGKSDKPAVTKPPRPYTEYNIFFQLEREYILTSLPGTDSSTPSSEKCDEEKSPSKCPQESLPMPLRYQNLDLPPNWYSSGKKKKRKHRKAHGKIGFIELTRMISNRWAEADDDIRSYCKNMALLELERYRADMKAYTDVHGIPKRKRKKRPSKAQKSKDQCIGGNGVVGDSKSRSASQASWDQPAAKKKQRLICTEQLPSYCLPVQTRQDSNQNKNDPRFGDEVDRFIASLDNKKKENTPLNGQGMKIDTNDSELMELWSCLGHFVNRDAADGSQTEAENMMSGEAFCRPVSDLSQEENSNASWEVPFQFSHEDIDYILSKNAQPPTQKNDDATLPIEPELGEAFASFWGEGITA